ncbi:MAG: PQQ-binding-like beta-propeller repeat protein [Alphaproteobacteria bacterium]|nr:PQQ-binding-like beta-propeller repeat protein [Alphaproteobacteria bacterium]MBV9370905.1 PQQ-binding-like beta-propeller repeat protein [Alphaproteobacteria bacterium]MBV9900684.1 PQQ-binding-like beta-propeller repeat protein [Alphaproteobacteria bacterium]
MKRLVLAIAAVSLLGGCGVLGKGKKPVTPTIGQRIAVLNTEAEIEADPTLAGIPVTLPAAAVNTEWTQSGGNAAKSMGHLGLASAPGQAWRVSIGQGSSKKGQLAAAPIFAEGKLFTMDTRAVVRAISPDNGATLWETQVRGQGGSQQTLFGGGVSYSGGRLYATNGAGYAAALDAKTGAIVWTVRPGGPLRGAPTVANDNVYVITQDNQLFALNPADGATRWTGSGAVEIAGVLGAAAPAAAQGTVVAGFSSGELTAYRYENGQVVWQDALARTSISTTVTSLSDIDADPVIDAGRVYAVGQGGRMVAIELITGQRVWEINVAGISTPWVAGDWIFVVTDQAQLLCIQRTTGHIRWLSQLTHYRNPKKKEGEISYAGPVLAGDRLILANSEGQLLYVSPATGAVQATVETKMPVSLSPIVANNTLYVLHDEGYLTAWR